MILQSCAELDEVRQQHVCAHDATRPCLNICGGTGCLAHGAAEVIDALRAAVGDAAEVRVTGCPGFCEQGPLLVVEPEGVLYAHVQPQDAADIVRAAAGGAPVDRLLYTDPATGRAIPRGDDIPFYARQTRVLLDQNGLLDPTHIDEYLRLGGYAAFQKALAQPPQSVVDTITRSGLRGRGGAGFPTGVKWERARDEISRAGSGFVVCNADEGDPGAFMDRSLVEGNPHRIIEGMLLGAYAIGARRGYVYIRAEYPLAVENMQIALEQAYDLGLLGSNLLGSGFDFDLEVRIGAGAFVCGEETALLASIEGRTGEPHPRPPYPTTRGLWGLPTVINNVKTWAGVPLIVERGDAWFRSIGSETSKGTMIFSLVGKVVNTGLVEVPLGISLRELVYDIGGGIRSGKRFKAAQIGGPSGGCLPAERLDTPLDYESLSALGTMVGSGGLVIVDEDTCMVDLARYFMQFVQEESCGKCTPCRVGTRALLDTLVRISAGAGDPGDLDYLDELAHVIRDASLCGLGQTAPNSVLTTLRYFHDEYIEHIYEKKCRALVCKGLIRYEIIPEKCTGCLVCLRQCTRQAITGEKLEPHVIHAELCEKCGVCKELCRFDAVQVVTGEREMIRQ